MAPFCEEHSEIRALRDDVFARLQRGEPPYGPGLHLCELIWVHQQFDDLMLFPSAREAAIPSLSVTSLISLDRRYHTDVSR